MVMKFKQQFRLFVSKHPLAGKALRSRWVALFGVLVMAWVLFQFIGVFQSAYDLEREFSAAAAKKSSLEKRNQELIQLLQKFDNPEFLEREAKDRLNLKNPGEEVAIIVPEQQATSSAQAEKGLWGRMKNWFPFLRQINFDF